MGVYGFQLLLDGSDHERDDLIEVSRRAPLVSVSRRQASFVEDRQQVSDDIVVVGFRGGSGFIVRRNPATIEVFLAESAPRAALVHPILTVPFSVLARWSGAVTLHAGAFEVQGGAWAVLGDREAGKSTVLAGMAATGCPILADDLLVIDGLEVRAGPRCVDLRPDVAHRFAGSWLVGEVGGRMRHRLRARAGSRRAALCGFLELRWHDEPRMSIERISTQELLRTLYAQEYVGLLGPVDPVKILDMLAVPAWRLTRPRDWSVTEALPERLLELAAGETRVPPSAMQE